MARRKQLDPVPVWSAFCESLGTRCTWVDGSGQRCDNGVSSGSRCDEHAAARRQRPDGSWTSTSAGWDFMWYWPVGTRVTVQGQAGTVIKQNSTTANVRLDAGRILHRVRFAALIRQQ